ncbi:uncharacterized protein LOC118647694 isoform X3 [Monomorium pharaonis]|uniref:uncharacterized protein LOC118647694 isoform X3 n=2 Tax=Monomorium pharaonis TaxID=307658 RepID=UPI001745F643|nr:uncharacterized protein LOC118647694 isoform X3 [Monomorium pharaonis]
MTRSLESAGDVITKDLIPFISEHTLNIICETAMGTSFQGISSLQQQYRKAVHRVGELLVYRIVFGPFKKYVNSACDAWILNNPIHTMNIYNIPEVVAVAYPLATSPTNIQVGFKCTGIFPYKKTFFLIWISHQVSLLISH